MEVFYHLIYEYNKEMRDFCLFTCVNDNKKKIENLLKKHKISYLIYDIEQKINVFFGKPDCIKILENFSSTSLNKLSAEEDFILGIMLGYGRNQQYKRLLEQKSKSAKIRRVV